MEGSQRSAIVTGGTSGIGEAIARGLVRDGLSVTITARDATRGDAARRRIADATGGNVDVLPLDLADLTSVRQAAASVAGDPLAVLVNNAGTIFGTRGTTVDGIERTLATNHVGPFLFTTLLIDRLAASGDGRIVWIASSAHGWATEGIRLDDLDHTRRYRQREAYGHSKLANILTAAEAARRYGDRGIHSWAVHPGLVRTDIGRGDSLLASVAYRLMGWRMRSADEGADTAVWLATTPDPVEPNGGYFSDREPASSARAARDEDAARDLWEATEALLARAGAR